MTNIAHQPIRYRITTDRVSVGWRVAFALSAFLIFYSLLVITVATDRPEHVLAQEETEEPKQGLPGRRLGGGTRWGTSPNTLA